MYTSGVWTVKKGREEEFDALVAASGQSVNAFLNDRVFGKHRRNPAARKQLALLLASAARITDQLHDITLAGAGESALAIESAHRELTEIRAALLTLMGRNP